ncbi:GRAM domain-containing protein 2B isoform X2 [Ictalurus furcatus]|uniref:GRAM domain-containing protein 2B isoform X2 n=1 Tax=Ictalurus furcatus TaxID=66913 RepID=UPI002350D42B|nr:GRAM domain-containing protein 2B isoform X2 [Ictalurus furcatus]
MEREKRPSLLERADAVEGEDVVSYPVESGTLLMKAKKEKMVKKKLEQKKAFSLEEAQLEMEQQSKCQSRPALPRSQTIGGPLERNDSMNSRSSFMKHNKTFHKLFPDIPESEDLLHAYICALQREVPYHGRLYITENNVCFHSSVLLKATKVVIPVSNITVLKKQNTALLVPNALSIRSNLGEKYLFVSLRNREGCYRLLRAVCLHLEDGSPNSSPLFSSAENSFDQGKLVNSSQSSLTDACEELDGTVSGLLLQPSPTILHGAPISNGSPSNLRSPRRDDESPTEEHTGGSWIWSVTDGARSLLIQRGATNFNTLLLIYLMLVVLLVLSSGYIGLRIVALEEQLTTLGALPEFTLHSGYDALRPCSLGYKTHLGLISKVQGHINMPVKGETYLSDDREED